MTFMPRCGERPTALLSRTILVISSNRIDQALFHNFKSGLSRAAIKRGIFLANYHAVVARLRGHAAQQIVLAADTEPDRVSRWPNVATLWRRFCSVDSPPVPRVSIPSFLHDGISTVCCTGLCGERTTRNAVLPCPPCRWAGPPSHVPVKTQLFLHENFEKWNHFQ